MTLSSLLDLFDRVKSKLLVSLIKRDFFNFGKQSSIQFPIRLSNPRSISIGNKCFIGRGSWLEVIESTNIPTIKIGDNVSFSGGCTITAIKGVEIKDGVLIAKNVHISDHSHAYNDTTQNIKDQGTTKPAEVTIDKGAWLGQGVVICPGAIVGKNSVIGANSVVTKSIPPNSIAVGSPAKVIKTIR